MCCSKVGWLKHAIIDCNSMAGRLKQLRGVCIWRGCFLTEHNYARTQRARKTREKDAAVQIIQSLYTVFVRFLCTQIVHSVQALPVPCTSQVHTAHSTENLMPTAQIT